MLGILLLARWAGCVDDNGHVPMDVVPLFETLEDLQQATATMQDCLKHPDYRQHVRAREDKQMVMLGYSDSNKDAGIVASRAALLSVQESLDETCRHQGVSLSLFHGRGGSISRGGGSLHKAVEATPISAASGVLRVTEQGEAIEQKFSARGIALRNLEQVSSATLEILLKRDHGDAVPQRWRNILACMAQGAEQRYRELMADSRLVSYFRHATPIDVIERLYIGSRPSKRVKDGDLGSLRAIPWVFSWGQSRHGLPGWFGMNAGIQKAMDNFDLTDIRDAISNWPFLQGIFDDVQMVMAKSDIRIAGRYAELAPDDIGTLYKQIEADFMDTESQFGTLQLAPLSETDPTLHRAIALRNPYIDPMSFLQVELLDQWRASDRKDDDLYAALVQTVQGIAAGLKNTG